MRQRRLLLITVLIIAAVVAGGVASSLHCALGDRFSHSSRSVEVCYAAICLTVLIASAIWLLAAPQIVAFVPASMAAALAIDLPRFDPPPRFFGS